MRIRTALVGGLLAVTTAAGTAPALAGAEAAAASGLVWQTNGWNAGPKSTAQLCTDDHTPLTAGQSVVLQVMRSGAWVTEKSVTVGDENSCLEVQPDELTGKPGSYYLRAVTRLSPGGPLLEGTTAVTLRTAKPPVYFEDNTDFYSLTTTRNRSVPLYVGTPAGQRVDVQRRVRGNWVTVSRTTVPATTALDALVRLPVPTRPGQATLRAVVRATAWTTQVISPVFTEHQTDTARYGSYLIAARKQMARFCPSTPIYVNPPAVQAGNPHGAIGMAMTDIDQYGADTWRFEGWILLRAGMTGKQLQHVALHECVHNVQGRAAIEDKYRAEMDKAWGLWPTVGHEGQADCMAWHLGRSTRDLYYVRGCNTTQQANAQRMWQAWGYRYTSAAYVFTPPSSTAAADASDDDAMEPRFSSERTAAPSA
jgi:hypothetical protein